MNINELHTKAISGDKAAETELFSILSARFQLIVHKRLWNRIDAEEVAQEALTVTFKEYKSASYASDFVSWAYKVLDNRMLAYFQNVKRNIDRKKSMANYTIRSQDSRYQPDPELGRRLLDCMKKLGQSNIRYARVLNYTYQGFSSEQICQRLKITRTNLYSILSRARSLLGFCLETGDLGK